MPLNKTLTTGEVKENIWPIDKINRFLFSMQPSYILKAITQIN